MGIATGGAVPAGADAVIPFEYVVENDNRSSYRNRWPSERASAPSGGDVRRGEVVVDAGTRLGPAQLGALAAAGLAEVLVARRPRAAVLATGSELRRPGELLEPGQIYEANGLLLAAQLESAGAEVERLDPVADDEAAHREALSRGLAADVLVTSGGVSVGPHDLVRMVEAELGVEEVFWGVAMKPGKPISFGVPGAGSSSGCPGTRSRRSSASSSSSGRLCSRSRAWPIRCPASSAGAWPGARAEPRIGTSSCGPGCSRRRGARARSASRARVAHDRAGSCGGRARPRADGRRRALGGRSGRVPPDLGPDGALPLASSEVRLRWAARTAVRTSRRPGPRRGRSAALGYGA